MSSLQHLVGQGMFSGHPRLLASVSGPGLRSGHPDSPCSTGVKLSACSGVLSAGAVVLSADTADASGSGVLSAGAVVLSADTAVNWSMEEGMQDWWTDTCKMLQRWPPPVSVSCCSLLSQAWCKWWSGWMWYRGSRRIGDAGTIAIR